MVELDKRDRGTITGRAPSRINDLGGWTDTWFSRHGNVLSIAALPGVECRLEFERVRKRPHNRLTIEAPGFGGSYSLDPDGPLPGRYPVIEAAAKEAGLPPDVTARLRVSSPIPPGSGTGTSASVAVAVLGTTRALSTGTPDPDSLWREAHRLETEVLGLQAGVQDQICAAYGGICYMEILDYPETRVSRLRLSEPVMDELHGRLLLVYLGIGHMSSDIHRDVIERLSDEGGESPHLGELRDIAMRGRDALAAGDLSLYGRLMSENTECQRLLHKGLVSRRADRVIAAAREAGASGWKVNGAGGEGGSLTLLAGEGAGAREELASSVESLGRGIECIRVQIDHEGMTITGH